MAAVVGIVNIEKHKNDKNNVQNFFDFVQLNAEVHTVKPH